VLIATASTPEEATQIRLGAVGLLIWVSRRLLLLARSHLARPVQLVDDWVDGAHGGPLVVSHGFAVEIVMLSPIAEGVGVAPKLRESGA
jgi:hypothetical protein